MTLDDNNKKKVPPASKKKKPFQSCVSQKETSIPLADSPEYKRHLCGSGNYLGSQKAYIKEWESVLNLPLFNIYALRMRFYPSLASGDLDCMHFFSVSLCYIYFLCCLVVAPARYSIPSWTASMGIYFEIESKLFF